MSSNHYLNHMQNTSPAKTAYSFSKGDRFPRFNSYFIYLTFRSSPNKFYDFPIYRSKRSTSLGFGSKAQLINKGTGDPGLY